MIKQNIFKRVKRIGLSLSLSVICGALVVALIGCSDTAEGGYSGPPIALSSALITDLSFDGANKAQDFWEGLVWPADRSVATVRITSLARNEGNISGSSSTGSLQYRDGSGDNWKRVILSGAETSTDYLVPSSGITANNLHRLRYLLPQSGTHNTFFTFRVVDTTQQVSNTSNIYFRTGNTPVSNDAHLIFSDITSDEGAYYFSPHMWKVYPGGSVIRFQIFCTSYAAAGQLQFFGFHDATWSSLDNTTPTNCTQGDGNILYSSGHSAIWNGTSHPLNTRFVRFKPTAGWRGTVVYEFGIVNITNNLTIRRSVTIHYRQ